MQLLPCPGTPLVRKGTKNQVKKTDHLPFLVENILTQHITFKNYH